MKYKILFYAIVVATIYFAGYFTHVKLHTCPIPEVQIDTLIQYEVVIDEKIVPVFKTKIEKDTVYSTDTLIVDKVQYIAEMDTIYREDSLLTLKVQFISPSPLDKRSHFSIDAKVREKIITETVHISEQVTYNPTFFIESGARVDTTLSCFIGAGVYPISYKYLKSYVKVGALYNNRWHGQAEAGLRVEF